MIYSMTGFGKSETIIEDVSYRIEIKSLNSKNFDLQVRLPQEFRSVEIKIRKWLENQLLRGKVYFQIIREKNSVSKAPGIHFELLKKYTEELQDQFPGLDYNHLIPSLLRNNEIWIQEEDENAEQLFQQIFPAMKKAVAELTAFRLQEGEQIEEDILKQAEFIKNKLTELQQFEPERIEKIRKRILDSLQQLQAEIDTVRFEQEMIYYLEKLDINEEISRLKNHLDFFFKTVQNKEISKGKKLNFIAQEMGREINTIGSKAADSKMQRLVVEMKDALEKIKEQTANIL